MVTYDEALSCDHLALLGRMCLFRSLAAGHGSLLCLSNPAGSNQVIVTFEVHADRKLYLLGRP
jgi:hypothetical protein